jgi:hypothetical protein
LYFQWSYTKTTEKTLTKALPTKEGPRRKREKADRVLQQSFLPWSNQGKEKEQWMILHSNNRGEGGKEVEKG